MNWRWVWIIDLATNRMEQRYLPELRIEWFKKNPNFKVQE